MPGGVAKALRPIDLVGVAARPVIQMGSSTCRVVPRKANRENLASRCSDDEIAWEIAYVLRENLS